MFGAPTYPQLGSNYLDTKVRSWSLKSIAKHCKSYLCWITAEHMLKLWTYIHHIIVFILSYSMRFSLHLSQAMQSKHKQKKLKNKKTTLTESHTTQSWNQTKILLKNKPIPPCHYQSWLKICVLCSQPSSRHLSCDFLAMNQIESSENSGCFWRLAIGAVRHGNRLPWQRAIL